MARKQSEQDAASEDALTSAAKAIGKVAGRVASAVGATGSDNPAADAKPPQTKSEKKSKLAPKNKQRLPRREKKARQKAASPQQ